MDRSTDERLGRRQLLTRAGAVAVGGAVVGLAGGTAEAAGTASGSPGTGTGAATADRGGAPQATPFGPVTVRPGDTRYDSLLRGDNWRFVGQPEEIRVVGSTEQVVQAVGDAVRSGRRIAVRSGGHCFENFTADPAVRILLDLSPMDAVGFDPVMGAFAVQPGATLGHVYRTLFKGWGVTIPAGGCPEVGAGGHLVGGGYGPLSRRYGSVVDHLHAVEVVVVDQDGSARAVVATRDSDDPNHDLWWAHAGGGGGNFGVVTRYWLRSPDATGSGSGSGNGNGNGSNTVTGATTDPTKLLPPAPGELLECLVVWAWDAKMNEQAFTTILRNFGTWHEDNSTPGSPAAGLYAVLEPAHCSAGSFQLVVQIDAGIPGADALVTDFVTALTADTDVTEVLNGRRTMPWLHPMTWPGNGEPGDMITRRYKEKAGYLRRRLTDDQLSTIYRHLTNSTGGTTSGMLLVGYGGQVNTVAPQATAVAQRDSIMKAVYHATWADESDDAGNLAWVRELYRDVYRDTGGVPVPGEVSDGSYINYPDVDLADPAWNTSGTPWHALYYKDNYPRLQQVKARWDPCDVFRHALGIEAPSA